MAAGRITEKSEMARGLQEPGRGSIFILDPSKRCEPSAYLFTKAVKFFLVNGYDMAKEIEGSDIILVNTCCVTQEKIAASRAALEFARANGRGKRIVLDPGGGGSDPDGVGDGAYERDAGGDDQRGHAHEAGLHHDDADIGRWGLLGHCDGAVPGHLQQSL